MDRMLRMLLCTGLLFCELFNQPATLHPQEPAEIFGYQAVRFEQSPGFSHYAALCRTPTEFSAQIPPNKLPKEVTESAVCWYVKASRVRSGGSSDASSAGDGKLVISAHHVRFIPHNPQLADLYADLQPERLELQHQPGDAYAILGSKDFAFNFRFSKLCPSCAPGTPIAPGFNPALLDREFGLLEESLRHFDSGWKQIYQLSTGTQLSSGTHVEPQPRSPAANSAASVPVHPAPEPRPVVAPKPTAPATSTGGFTGEPAEIFGYKAVRFEQSPGFFHYAALCRTPTEFSAQIPPNKLPKEVTESAVCWYVKASRIRSGGKDEATQESDGKLVISSHHVRFLPHNLQLADLYADLQPERLELQHQPGDAYATLGSKDFAFKFRFSKLCLSCAPGTPIAPGFNPALLDQEFGLLDESLRRFESGWKQIYQLSSGIPLESQPRIQTANAVGSTAMHLAPERNPVAAAKPGTPAPGNSNAAVVDRSEPASVPKTASVAAARPPAQPAPVLRKPAANPVRIASGAAAGMLVKKVEPVYPLEAKVVRLEGTVVLRAIIDSSGEIFQVQALSGPPLLESAAVDAVKQWQFKPYLVNGQPVDVETTIQVVFALDGSPQANRPQRHP